MFTVIEEEFRQYNLSNTGFYMALDCKCFLEVFDDPSHKPEDQQQTKSKNFLKKMHGCTTSNLQESPNLEFIIRLIEQKLILYDLKLHGLPQRKRKPNSVDDISTGIYQLFVNIDRSTHDQLYNIQARLVKTTQNLQPIIQKKNCTQALLSKDLKDLSERQSIKLMKFV